VTAALLVLAVPVALACPAHMWWQMRRGRLPGSCLPAGKDSAAVLDRRQQALRAQLACFGDAQPRGGPSCDDYAVRR
jgi:hypothetical protein